MSKPIRALVVDDEPPARKRVIQLLAVAEGVQVVAECRNGEEAVKQILRLRPDLVFLDIQMPALDGFGVVQTVGAERLPPVVFVTAYDTYALKAFDAAAVDYLLKPYTRERFGQALERALGEVAQRRRGTPRQLDSLLRHLHDDERVEPRILVQSAHRVEIVRVADIDWIQAAGNYVVLHTDGAKHLHRESMKGMLAGLNANFVRIHRSFIVNVQRVKGLVRSASGDCEVVLKSGAKLPGSRRYSRDLIRLLET